MLSREREKKEPCHPSALGDSLPLIGLPSSRSIPLELIPPRQGLDMGDSGKASGLHASVRLSAPSFSSAGLAALSCAHSQLPSRRGDISPLSFQDAIPSRFASVKDVSG